MFQATYIYTVFQYQACVYRTQAQYDRSHVLLTEMFAIEKIQVVMKEKQQYIAHHVRLGVSLIRHAASTSPVESMNSNIKGKMGCFSNMNTSTSRLKMAKGSNRRVTMFDNEAQRALQMTFLASKMIIKDTILKQCLHICNQNFDKRKYYKCVQCSEDDWMVWNFYYYPSNIKDNIADMVPKISMYFMSVLRDCSVFHFSGVIACSKTGERYVLLEIRIHMFRKYEFILSCRIMNSYDSEI